VELKDLSQSKEPLERIWANRTLQMLKLASKAHQETPRGDGLVPVKTAAKLLKVSTATIHLWAQQGVYALTNGLDFPNDGSVLMMTI
jgi:hypothetical protein